MIPSSTTIETGLAERYAAHRHDMRYVAVGGTYADLVCNNCHKQVTVQHIPHGGYKTYPYITVLDTPCGGTS